VIDDRLERFLVGGAAFDRFGKGNTLPVRTGATFTYGANVLNLVLAVERIGILGDELQ